MILTCPNCGTQYVVKDGAIPPQGRQVRCAACKHSWHQESEIAPVIDSDEVPAPQEPDQADETLAGAAMIDPSSGPEAEARAFEEAAIEEAIEEEQPSTGVDAAESEPEPVAEDDAMDESSQSDILPHSEAPAQDLAAPSEAEVQPDDDFSPFAERDFVETRRRGPILKILIALLVIAALAIAFWFYAPPQWKARLGLADSANTPLQLSNPPHMELTPLASGNQLLTVAGRVINPTGGTEPVPPISARLRDRTGKVVYSWTIAPPAPTIGPGESKAFNSAEVDVPPGAENLTLEISLGSSKG